MNNIVIENKRFALTLGEDARALSLILKENGEECLDTSEGIAFFSLTEERPYNNEIKLAHPNKKTTFQANSLTLEGDKLIIGFELIAFKAVVKVKKTDDYISFELEDFLLKPETFGGLMMSPPPVYEMLPQLRLTVREGPGSVSNGGTTALLWEDLRFVPNIGSKFKMLPATFRVT